MQKDFDRWNKIKKSINNRNINFFCNKREIWWSSIGLNVGSEEDGKNNLFERPILIIKVFNKDLIRILPLTSRYKKDKNYIPITFNNTQNFLIVSQLKAISTKRLSRKLGRLDKNQFKNILARIKLDI